MSERHIQVKSDKKHTIVVVGAGFAGLRCMLDLARKQPVGTSLVLITDRPYFLYYPAMYRVATGSSPLQAQIPLADIFSHLPQVTVIEDRITAINTDHKQLVGQQSTYRYDTVVLALGSEPRGNPFPALGELSFNFLTMHEAMRMREHIDTMFEQCQVGEIDESLARLHFVIVGAGASGVEVAGELARYARGCADAYHLGASLVTIDLVDRNPRVLARLAETVSERVVRRLRMIGVHVFANRSIMGKDDASNLLLSDMEMTTKTIIWTAGTRVHSLYDSVAGFERDETGKVVVSEQLEAKGFADVFVAGDAAAVPLSGLAQSALHQGAFVARVIRARLKGRREAAYTPAPVFHSIPVGPRWGLFVAPWFTIYGRLAWYLRHLIDIRFYLSILPLRRAWHYIRARRQ